MATWLILLIAALVAAVIGFGTAAKWLLLFAALLLAVGLAGLLRGTRSRPRS
jgi:hypothetical protein